MTWLNADDFVQAFEGRGDAKGREWAEAVASMDPDHQAAEYLLSSNAKDDCGWFTMRPVEDSGQVH